jgi:hypothetical protein
MKKRQKMIAFVLVRDDRGLGFNYSFVLVLVDATIADDE